MTIPLRAAFRIEAGLLHMHVSCPAFSTPPPALRLLRCAERELKRRRRWYANRVVAGRMTVAEAACELWEMEGIVCTLRESSGFPPEPAPDEAETVGWADGP